MPRLRAAARDPGIGTGSGATAWSIARRLRQLSVGLTGYVLGTATERVPMGASRIIRRIGVCLIAATILIVTFAVHDMREHAKETYRREIANLGTALAEQTSRYIEEIDNVLREVQVHCTALGIRSPEEYRGWLITADAHEFLLERLHNMAQVDALVGIDAGGRVVNSTRPHPNLGMDVSDRDYFRHATTQDDPQLFISERVTSRVTGKPSAYVARRVSAPDGTFLGVVAGTIDIAYLDNFYQSISTGPGQAVTLLRRDGLILTRYPDRYHDAGTYISTAAPWYRVVAAGGGSYNGQGYLGGAAPALVSVHPLAVYPLVVDVSVKERVALAAWRGQAEMLGLAGVVAVLGFGLLFWIIGALFQRQEAQHKAVRQTADALRHSEAQLAEKSYLLEATLDHMDQGLMMIASDRTVPICNRRALELLDLPGELMARQPAWEEVIAYQQQTNEFATTDPDFQDTVRRTLLLHGPLIYDRERPNGRVIEVRTTPLPQGEAVRTYTDITERKQAERRIEFLAYHDGLTGLANRALLNDRLSQALAHARQGGGSLALLALDLDRFNTINDTFGHEAGDQVLRQIADRLRHTIGAADTVARNGGDGFLVLQMDTAQPGAALQLAQRILCVAAEPFDLSGKSVVLGVSIGIALHPADGLSAAELLKAADMALYRAKADGRGVARLFDADMDRDLRERRSLVQDLRDAIGTDQLDIHFQPQFACLTETLTGFEALLRWRHPLRGNISPDVFIPLAEEARLISDLGAWVMREACATAAAWPTPYRVAVNLSAAQFAETDLADRVADILASTGLPAQRLEIEVTESLLLERGGSALATLRAFKAMGVLIALDDFGTGYSSLSYLRRFPFDKVKIDKSFVQALGQDASGLPIVQAILAMCRSLNLDVIAEGVETEHQLRILRAQGCGEIQGFLLGRPQPRRELDRLFLSGTHIGSYQRRDTAAAHHPRGDLNHLNGSRTELNLVGSSCADP